MVKFNLLNVLNIARVEKSRLCCLPIPMTLSPRLPVGNTRLAPFSCDSIREGTVISVVGYLICQPPISKMLFFDSRYHSSDLSTIFSLRTAFRSKVVNAIVCPNSRSLCLPTLISKRLNEFRLERGPMRSG